QRVLADEVEQQVERAFEGLEEDRQRFRRDVEVRRQLDQRLAAHPRERQRERERRLLVGLHGGIVGCVCRHFFPNIAAAPALLSASPSWAVSGTSTRSQANFTPRSRAEV